MDKRRMLEEDLAATAAGARLRPMALVPRPSRTPR
jgi:hypothetical protein